MNILMVIPWFAPAWIWGGPPKLAYDLSRELVNRGHMVTVYTTDAIDKISRQEESFLEMEGIKVFYLRNLSNSLAQNHMLFFPPGMIPRLRREVKSFDVIHLQNYRDFLNVMVHHYAKKFCIPYVLQANGSVLPIFQKKGLKRFFDGLFGYGILKDATRFIAVSQTEVNEYKQMRVDQGRIVLIPPPYPIEEFSQLPPFGNFKRRFNIKEKHIVLFLGRIHPIKGIDFLVESFCQLSRQREDVMLAIVGPDGGLRSSLELLIDNLGLSRKVLFTGFLGGEDKLSALVDADMLVQTSIYERGPGSPFEAILCNTPIIVTEDTGCGEIVGEVDAGYLVKYGDVDGLKTMMQKVLDDPAEARDKMRKAKQYILANLSCEKIVDQYERLYQSVIKQGRVG